MIVIINVVKIDIDTYKISYSNGFFDYVCKKEKDRLLENTKQKAI